MLFDKQVSGTVGKPAIARLQKRDETITLACGEFLFREGDEADALYVVKRGVLRIVSGSTVYETVRAGGIIGEMAIIDEGAPRSASVIACTFAELVRIDALSFREKIAENPDFALAIMRTMSRRLRIMNRRYRAPAEPAFETEPA